MSGDDRALRVVVADDEDDVRVLLALQLEQAGFDVVGEAANGRETMEMCEAHRPDCLVLDLRMPRTNGLELVPRLRASHPGLGIVAHTAVVGNLVRTELARLQVPLVPKSGDVTPLANALRAAAARAAPAG